HAVKAGTPTMGGVLIISALVLATVMLADIGNSYVVTALFGTIGFGVIGFLDDYLKLTRKNSKGLPPRTKLLCQFLVAFIVALVLYFLPRFSEHVAVPFIKNIRVDLGLLYIPFAM